ncbi:MAG: MotA/TolQ/ExbB proton channel family protein, partial [Cyanobacteria bacterium P01_C01_bin.72]
AIATLFFASVFRGFYLQQISLIQEVGGQLELLHLDQYELIYKYNQINYESTNVE